MDKQLGSRQNIGRNIRRVRVQAGLTQQQLASRLDLSQQTIQKYEQGGIAFTTDRIELIAQELGCESSSLLSATPTPRDRGRASHGRSRVLSSFEQEALDELARIRDLRTKRLALQMLRALADSSRG